MMVTDSFSVNALKVLIIKPDRKLRGSYHFCIKYHLGHRCEFYHQTMLYLASFWIFYKKNINKAVFDSQVKIYTNVCLPTIFGVILQHPGIVM